MASEVFSRNIQNEAYPTARSRGEPLQSPRSPPDLTQASPPPFQESTAPFQESTASSQESSSPPQTRRQKRSRNSNNDRAINGDRASKRVQTDLRAGSELSEDNLRRLDEENLRRLGSNMSAEPNALSQTLKRSQSQKSMTSASEANQNTPSVSSQRSSDVPPAPYRFQVLYNARAYVQWGPPPNEIQDYIKYVIRGESPQERMPEETVAHQRQTAARKARLSPIVQGLMNDFKLVFAGPVREDHSVEPIYNALSLMNSDGKFGLLRKADWEMSLKPRQTDDFTWISTKKRKLGESPSGSILPPPSQGDMSLIKTPRPDITLGLLHDTIVKKLMEHRWTESKADRILRLQQERQILISDPTKHGILRFPVLVVEGKAYATGKQLFEAENQALVSGACMANLQHQLTDLADLASSDGSDSKVPAIAFCISTEGPILELCVISTATNEGNRKFNMYIIKSCHVCVFDELLDWLLFLKDVVNWAESIYLDDVVKKIMLADNAGWDQVPNRTDIPSTSQVVGI